MAKRGQRFREWLLYQLLTPLRFGFEWWMKRQNAVLLYCIMGNGLGDAMAISTILNALHQKYGTRGIVFSMHPDLFAHNPQVIRNLSYKAMASGSRSLFKILLRALRGPAVICIGGEVWTVGTSPFDHRDLHKQRQAGWNWLQKLLPDYRPPIGFEGIYPKVYFSAKEDKAFASQYQYLEQPFAILKASVGIDRPEGTYLKDWDLQKITEVVANTPEVQWVQLGDKTETPVAGALNLLGKTNIREAMWLVAQSRFVLSVEGFITHVAAAFDKPAITPLTGAYDPNTFIYQNTIPLMAKPMPPCSPCWAEQCTVEGMPCRSGITVTQAQAAVASVLRKDQ